MRRRNPPKDEKSGNPASGLELISFCNANAFDFCGFELTIVNILNNFHRSAYIQVESSEAVCKQTSTPGDYSPGTRDR